MPEANDERWDAHTALHVAEREALRTALSNATQLSDQHIRAHDDAHTAHAKVHSDEQLAVRTALSNVDKERDIHAAAHEREHSGHAIVHHNERGGIQVALDAVSKERDIHAKAHEREHAGHEREHQLDKLAITKVEQASDIRFAGVNEFRAQLADQAKTFATIATVEARAKERHRRLEDVGRTVIEKYEDNRKRIENLEKGTVKAEGKGLGQGSVVGIIVGGIGVVATMLGIIIIIANFASAR